MTKFTSKVKMPEPKYKTVINYQNCVVYTSEQMEAYANERVKEALEAAAQLVGIEPANSNSQDLFKHRAVYAVRALIPNDTE